MRQMVTWLLSCGHERSWGADDQDWLQEFADTGTWVKCYECPAHLNHGSGVRIAADVTLERKL